MFVPMNALSEAFTKASEIATGYLGSLVLDRDLLDDVQALYTEPNEPFPSNCSRSGSGAANGAIFGLNLGISGAESISLQDSV
eukprot:129710-Rhodomonas_salina.1